MFCVSRCSRAGGGLGPFPFVRLEFFVEWRGFPPKGDPHVPRFRNRHIGPKGASTCRNQVLQYTVSNPRPAGAFVAVVAVVAFVSLEVEPNHEVRLANNRRCIKYELFFPCISLLSSSGSPRIRFFCWWWGSVSAMSPWRGMRTCFTSFGDGRPLLQSIYCSIRSARCFT